MRTHLSISEQFTPISGKNTPLNLHCVTMSLHSLIFQQVTCFWSCCSKANFEGWAMPPKAQSPCLPPRAKALLCPQSNPLLSWCYSFREPDAWSQSPCRYWTPIYKDHSTPMEMLREVEKESVHPRDLAFSKLHQNLYLRLKTTSINLCISTEIFTYW